MEIEAPPQREERVMMRIPGFDVQGRIEPEPPDDAQKQNGEEQRTKQLKELNFPVMDAPMKLADVQSQRTTIVERQT